MDRLYCMLFRVCTTEGSYCRDELNTIQVSSCWNSDTIVFRKLSPECDKKPLPFLILAGRGHHATSSNAF
jgi:hypothetical protein